MRRILTTLAVWLALAAPAWAACTGASPTWTAASAATTDVSDCVTAASAGDTINVPAGSATWSSAVTVSKALSIIGAGSGAGGTVLTGSGALASGFFYVTNFTSTALVRISGFRFTMSARAQACAIKVAYAIDLTSLRIDHNRFDNGGAQIILTGSKGVVDHNDFYNGDKGIDFSAGSRAQQDASWVSMAAGTSDAMFIEDNNFVDDASYPVSYSNEKIGTEGGGKLVVRYNHFDADASTATDNFYPFMAHGNACGGCSGSGYWQDDASAKRGQSVIEFYYNTMHRSGGRLDFMYVSRGSANLVHHNAVEGTTTYAPNVYFYEEEQWSVGGGFVQRLTWPAEDQVHNSFIWDNTYNGASRWTEDSHISLGKQNADCTAPGYAGADVQACCTGSGTGTCDFIVRDREFFLHAPAATGGKASFTGSNGGSNTHPTDGDPYATLGTMTFSASGANEYYGYVPYTYPHPLVAGTAPNAPVNVRIR